MIDTAINLLRSAVFQIGTAVIRAGLMVVVGWLTARKLIDDSLGIQLLAVVPSIAIAVAWAYVERKITAHRHFKELMVALGLPARSTLAHLDEALRREELKETKPPAQNGGTDK